MQFTTSLLALCATILPVIASDAHSNLHKRVHARELTKRITTVSSKIQLAAVKSSFSGVKEGSDPSLPYQNTIINNSTQTATVVFWSDGASFLPLTAFNNNPSAANLILTLEPGATKTVSFSDSYHGAYAPIWSDTGVDAGGQVHEPWIEVGTTPAGGQWGKQTTIDVSFLINMGSKFTSVTTDLGCVSDWTQCSYKCNDGSAACMTASVSELIACQGPAGSNNAQGSAPGPWNGGCRADKTWTTTFGGPGS